MNAERLHVIAKAIKADLQATNVVTLMQSLVSSLSNQVSQPGQPAYQQQVAANLEALATALSDAPSNRFSPAWRQVLEEIGVARLLGQALLDAVKDSFARNGITPAVALEALNKTLSEINTLVSANAQLLAAFEHFQIASEELKAGECEIGVLVPRAFVDNDLLRFAEELEELAKIIGVFAELTTGSRPPVQVNTISSSDLSVFLSSAPVVAAALAKATVWLIDAYKKLLEIRKLQAELREQGIPEASLKGIDEHANKLMECAIRDLVPELMKMHPPKDGGRANELKVELTFAARKLANRIDQGFNIEVRAGPAPEAETSSGEGRPAASDVQHLEAIAAAAKDLQFLRLDGAPLLSLPEAQRPAPKPEDHDGKRGGGHEGKKREPK